MWFPKPDNPAGVVPLGAGGPLSGDTIHSLLLDADAEEWRDKVGVAGPVDGSAKDSTRLLAVQGHVLKASLCYPATSPQEVAAALETGVRLARRTSIWHPTKQWFALEHEGSWFPASVCRRLQTLREPSPQSERFDRWTQMMDLAFDVTKRHQVGLDVNPSNFGIDVEEDPKALYYIDDELYGPTTHREAAEAIVSRIPEEVTFELDAWEGWGQVLQVSLGRICHSRQDWELFFEGLDGYPLHARFGEARKALATGIRSGHPLLDAKARRRQRSLNADLTCVLADVHSNLPALDAVLKEARRLGSTDFLFLGDAVGYGPHPQECVERLASLPRLTRIRGNHDHAIGTGTIDDGMNRLARECATWTRACLNTEALSWLTELPIQHRSDSWMAIHGAPLDPERFVAYVYEMTFQKNLDKLEELECGLCFYGHTHVPFVHRQERGQRGTRLGPRTMDVLKPNEVVLVNPGSVGQPRDGDTRAAFALWDRQTNRVSFHRVDYAQTDTIRDLQAAGLPSDLVYRLELGR